MDIHRLKDKSLDVCSAVFGHFIEHELVTSLFMVICFSKLFCGRKCLESEIITES